ncbi:MAG: type II toxin-antitoxin system VapC family toxin [Thermoproteus sp.]
MSRGASGRTARRGRYVFDSSAIVKLVELSPKKSVELLDGQYTADLAYYEIGNYIWKLHKRSAIPDAAPYVEFFSRMLSLMSVERVGLRKEVADLAAERGLTYYDAVYLWLAQTLDVPLVTEDEDLCKAAAKCVKAAELLEGA